MARPNPGSDMQRLADEFVRPMRDLDWELDGVVVQHVGRVVIGPDDQPISLSGKFAEFDAAYMDQDFCAALA
jgi:hypothetical protein